LRFWFRKDKGAAKDPEVSPGPAAMSPAGAEPTAEKVQEAARKVTFLKKISSGLRKTSEVLNTPVEELIRRSPKISRETLDSLEEVLIRADIGPAMSLAIVDTARAKLKKGELDSGERLRDLIKKEILFTLREA